MLGPEDLTGLELGQSSPRLEINQAEEHNLVATHMLNQAQRQFYVVARDLDRKIFDRDNFSAALLQLARMSRYSDIRFLLHDTEDAVRYGHEVLRLAQRMSSYIQVCIIGDDHKQYNESFVLADRKGVIYRGLSNRYDALVEYNHPRLAAELQNTFDDMWAHAHTDPNFRQLHI